ncbi:MAG: DUF2188 domain-containing protein [Methanomassiliicoccaceae archaeon]|nr:DUF2188 domain-containing protein [Methanomassiliicoccaceae archaeon]
MSFFERFKKKEETPKKEEEPKKDVKSETKKKDNAWATSREKPVEETKEEPKMAEKKSAAKPAAKKSENKVWHITKRDEDGMWQVKAEGAERATKLFRTKAEAEEYVKTLVSNNEGSRVVKHKKTGEFQKK